MSALTRVAASSFSLVSSPRIFVFTGPAAGKVSDIVSAWNRIAASASTVENTPHAPSHGSVRSSYLKPSTSRPLTNVSAQSLRLSMSDCTCPMRSSDKDDRSLSSIISARLAPNSVKSASVPGIMVISIPPSDSVTASGSMISISSSGTSISSKSVSSSSIPSGAENIPFSIAIAYLLIISAAAPFPVPGFFWFISG